MQVSFRDPNETEKLMAGTYLVIDPCYIFRSGWDKVVDALFPDEKTNKSRIVMEVGTHKVYIWSTAYGDGRYPVMDAAEPDDDIKGIVGVDAGVLSFIPAALIAEMESEALIEEMEPVNVGLGVWVTLTESSVIVDKEDGDLEVGHLWVCTCGCATGDDEDEDEDDWDEDEDEDWEEEEESDESDN